MYKKGKKKKTYAEVLKSGNSFINEGIKCGKNGTVLTGNKHDAHVRKNSSKAANTFAIKFAINLCLVVDPPLEKELSVASIAIS